MNKSKLTKTFWLCAAALAATACVQPPSTPYRAITEGQGPFGYATQSLDDIFYRVDFNASPTTPERTAMAFALFRAAELAQTLHMAAFTIVEGPVDRTLLEGEEIFSRTDSTEQHKVKGSSPIYIPIIIPNANVNRPQPKLVILRVRMHEQTPTRGDPRTFVTRDVIDRLGPRIVRSQPA